MISIAFSNYGGVSVTKYMSATTRTVLNTQRMILIWIISITLHFQDPRWTLASLKDAFWLQLVGFVMIVIGNFLYSDAIIMPTVRTLRRKRNMKYTRISLDDVDADDGLSGVN